MEESTQFVIPLSRHERLLIIDRRMRSFQNACNQKLSDFTAFFNAQLDNFVQQLICELEEISGQDINGSVINAMVVKDERAQENDETLDGDDNDHSDFCPDDDDFKEPNEESDLRNNVDSINAALDDDSVINQPIIGSPEATTVSTKIRKIFQCDICADILKTKNSFIIHRRSHTTEKILHCDICKRSFNYKQSLAIHMRTHTDERPYMCHLCSKTFKQSTPFRRHMRTHTLDKPHQCPMCDRAFIEKSYLKVHMQSHTGERPHICPVCNRGYTKRYHVRQHLKNFHKVADVNSAFPQNQRRSNNTALVVTT